MPNCPLTRKNHTLRDAARILRVRKPEIDHRSSSNPKVHAKICDQCRLKPFTSSEKRKVIKYCVPVQQFRRNNFGHLSLQQGMGIAKMRAWQRKELRDSRY